MKSCGMLARFAVALVVLGSGCGLLVDKGRIQIATLNGKSITRGDLEKVIRDLPPEERPTIRTKGDVLNALDDYLDKQIKAQNAEALKREGKIYVPRELAEQLRRIRHPEEFIEMQNPEEYNLRPRDIEYMKEEREIGIDEELKRLEGEMGIRYLVNEAKNTGQITISEEEFAREYNLRKDQLVHPEKVRFAGILIPVAHPDAHSAVVAIRNRVRTGESLDSLAREFSPLGAQIIESGLQKDARDFKYAGFWEQASGAKVGDVLGPIFIQGWKRVRVDATGAETEETLPDALMVCRILDRVDEVPKTLEEAKPDLIDNLLYAKVMEQLRQKAGVQIFEAKLPDPSMYDTGPATIMN